MTVMTVRMFSNMKVDFLAKWLLSVLDSSQVLLMMQTLLSMILPNEPIMLLESSLSIGWDDNYDDETLSHSIIVLRFYRFYRQLWVLDYRVMSWTVIWCCIIIMIVVSSYLCIFLKNHSGMNERRGIILSLSSSWWLSISWLTMDSLVSMLPRSFQNECNSL